MEDLLDFTVVKDRDFFDIPQELNRKLTKDEFDDFIRLSNHENPIEDLTFRTCPNAFAGLENEKRDI